ncbi:hypothetical protein KKHLCK_11200 [Candidatus Electrothrix laxa]
MIMGNHKRDGVMSQGRLDQFAGIDCVHIDGTLGENFTVDHGMGGIKVDNHKDLVLKAPQGVDQIIRHILGRGDIALFLNPLAQIATGDSLDKLEGKDILRPHAFDFFQEHRRGIQDLRQGTEFCQGIYRRLFAVGTRGTEGQ